MASDPSSLPPPQPSPWDEVRAEHPGVVLVRVIAGRLQFWITIGRTEQNLERGAEVYDGATVILPRPADAPVDLADVIAAADLAWQQQKQPCRSTSPTTGASA